MKSTSIISLGTLSSRIFGFIRDILLAQVLGTGFSADALFVAFRIPNLFRNFVGEGATNAAVVPVFSEHVVQQKKEDLSEFFSVSLTLTFILLAVLTLGGILLAPFIVRLIAPGFMADPEKLETTIRLTRIIFPYLIFIGLTAFGMAVLFSHRSFITPAFSPCLLNIALIFSAVISARFLEEPVYGIALGILLGGFLQMVVHIPPVLKTGLRFRRPSSLAHPGAFQIGRLLLPRIAGAGVYQLTVLIDTFCASLSSIIGPGGISAIYYSNRIIQFPMGIFTIALASAVLPSLSGMATNGQLGQLKKTVAFSLENIFFVMFPTTIIMMILAHPIIQVLFERGEFNSYSTRITSSALLFYAAGLFSFGGIKILVTAFHSLQDTRTPVVVSTVSLIINAALNFLLMGPMKIGGIALASTITATINFLILFYFLRKRLGPIFTDEVRAFLARTLSAAFWMGTLLFFAWTHLSVFPEAARLAATGLLGYVVYGIISFQMKVPQSRKFFHWVVRQGSRF